MRSHLGVQAGRSMDLWFHTAGSQSSQGTSSNRSGPTTLSGAATADTQAIAKLAEARPDLALALQRLAGIDPEQRQAQYEAIRREVLHLSQDGTLNVDLNAESGGGSAYESLPNEAKPGDEPEQAPNIKPLSPNAVILQAYQQVSRNEPPKSLLTIASA